MKDESILKHIDKLLQEEQDLYRKEERSPEETKRLQQLEVELDQGWDLLRQRRAKREFGKDPDQAEVRPAEVVEDYEN
jgi:Protein of unknown function (DUF2630)